ncbi:hypothetical protein R2X24_21565 [Citrobacter portucalensis]|uniref:hypothetical protein n=3 Tax=Citrobacter portucalensis TaxID=1639133 RepID=UPI002B30D1B0|nr:hypothetical protein [Citrobacter portucalensis]EIP1108651.1 hypothetical protein [Citrobacter freundii]WOR29708.1 hypothetical protein R2X24_21565 [Citrobacter portucalensis]
MPYPAYGAASLVPDGGYALSGLRSGIACAGWRLRLIRPTERHRLCRMAAMPYPAYGTASLVPDGGYALSGLRNGIACAGWRLRLIRPTERHRLCRMAATPYPAYGAALVVGLISEAHQAIERKNV